MLESGFNDEVVFVPFIAETLPCVFAHAMQRQGFDSCKIFLRARKHHSTFAGRHILSRIKTKATEVAKRSSLAAVIFRLDGVGAVFDYFQPVMFGDIGK